MKTATTTAAQLEETGRRLDASYHASEGVRAHQFIRAWAGQTVQTRITAPLTLRETSPVYGKRRAVDTLADVCMPGGIFIPGRFRRIYVDDPAHGEPWLSPSDMLKADLTGLRLISRKFTPAIETLRVRQGWILLSRSGTIGNMAYVRSDMDALIGSDDIIRIVPDPDRIPSGYLYTWLNSPLARALIEQKTYGAVVPHIEAHHVVDLSIPRIDAATELHIHELIERATELRVQANRMLNEVSQRLSKLIGPVPTAPDEQEQGFIIRRKDMVRLTAFNNKPSIDAARQAINSGGNFARLGDVTLRVFHPFRMNMVYVAREKGVPFLNLSDMMSGRYRTSNYMSALTQGYEDYLLKYGWTLISRDGTIGKVCFVGRYLEGTATNQHISRIIPNTTSIPPGYLYAFMASSYAQLQIDALVYGSVIQGIYEKDLMTILIALPDRIVMQSIGKAVEDAFENRHKANWLEDQAQTRLAEALGGR